MPTKDEPIITFRASWEMKSRIADEVLRRGLRSKGEFIRLLLEEALSSGERSTGGSPRSAQPPSVAASPRAAVEQASEGSTSVSTRLPASERASEGLAAGSLSEQAAGPSAPAEPPQLYKCPRGCDPGWRPSSPLPRCRFCNRETVPV